MSLDKLVDSTQLDSDLTSVANAIRAKSGGSSQLAFPAGFVSEIGNIPSGGGGLTLLASGSFTRTGTSPVNLSISVSYTGTPKVVLVCVSEPLSDIAQGVASYLDNRVHNEYQSEYFPNGIMMLRYRKADNNFGYQAPASNSVSITSTTITANRIASAYIWQANTYKWYIWGEAST